LLGWSIVRNSEIIVDSSNSEQSHHIQTFIINAEEKTQDDEGKDSSNTIPASLHIQQPVSEINGVNEWVYNNLLEPVYPNPSNSNLAVAANVTVSDHNEISIDGADKLQYDDEEEGDVDYLNASQDWKPKIYDSQVRRKKRSGPSNQPKKLQEYEDNEKYSKFPLPPYFCNGMMY